MKITLLFFVMAIIVAARPAGINTSEELVRAMHDRYAKTWYKTLTFTQKTTTYKPDGTTQADIWYEYLLLPGRLRIDFDPIKNGNGMLFASDSQYIFKDGALSRTVPRIHPLLLLGFDVYALTPDQTLSKLKQLGFDLTIMHEDTWQGRPAYVVGAKTGDLHSRQFWIDKENLYFVRLIQPAGKDGAQTQETQFNKYYKIGGGWVSPEVIFMTDGKPTTIEEYSEMKIGMPLDNRMFDPDHWKTNP